MLTIDINKEYLYIYLNAKKKLANYIISNI